MTYSKTYDIYVQVDESLKLVLIGLILSFHPLVYKYGMFSL